MEGQLAAVDDDLLDRVAEAGPPPARPRARRRPRRTSRRTGAGCAGTGARCDQAAVAGGVAGALDAEHARAGRPTRPAAPRPAGPGRLRARVGCVRRRLRRVARRSSRPAHRCGPSGHDVQRGQAERAFSSSAICRSRFAPSLRVLDLVVQLEDRVDQHLRPRRAAGQVHVDRHDVVDALDDRVVVEHAAAAGADAHREHPLGLGHLVVDLAQHRRHLLADPAGHDHQVGLARGGAEDLHAEAGEVVAGPAGRHHLDGAAGQAEGGRPERALRGLAGEPSRRSSAGRRSAASLRYPSVSVPLQAAAPPDVGVGDEHGDDEQHHLDQPEDPELRRRRRPTGRGRRSRCRRR